MNLSMYLSSPHRGPLTAGLLCTALYGVAVSLAHARTVEEGAMVVSPAGSMNDSPWALVDLRTGQRTSLPRSDFSRHYQSASDNWTADPVRGDMVRVDEGGHVEFFDRRTLRRTGGFSLSGIPGTDSPKLFSALKPSRDGKYLLGYWKANYREDEPSLVVFDRQGRVVQAHPPIARGLQTPRDAFDWLPNGQFIYLVEDKIVLGQIGNWAVGAARLALPSGHKPEGDLVVSPDAKRIVLSVTASAGGGGVSHSTLFTANLNGSGLRPLTVVQPDGGEPVRQGHTSPSWSPSGKWIAFSVSIRSSLGAGTWESGCPPVFVVPSEANGQPVNSLQPGASTLLTTPGGLLSKDKRLTACGSSLLWIER